MTAADAGARVVTAAVVAGAAVVARETEKINIFFHLKLNFSYSDRSSRLT